MWIGIPYAVVELICVSWNLIMNIDFNKGWAGGNIWLVGNTLQLLK